MNKLTIACLEFNKHEITLVLILSLLGAKKNLIKFEIAILLGLRYFWRFSTLGICFRDTTR